MGPRFDLASSNIVTYLSSHKKPPPSLERDQLTQFLVSLTTSDELVSNSPELVHEVRVVADTALRSLTSTSEPSENGFLDPSVTEGILHPLVQPFREFTIFIFPVGTSSDQKALAQFAGQAARLPGATTLVLTPAVYGSKENVQVMDPDMGIEQAIRNRDQWPGAIFSLWTGWSTFLPLDEAQGRLATIASGSTGPPVSPTLPPKYRHIANGTELNFSGAWSVLSARQTEISPARRRLLHLSDLHLGAKWTRNTKQLLIASLTREIETVDEIVISGDLFDQPFRKHQQAYEDFIFQLQAISGKKPIPVPGNHDQRIFGLKWWSFLQRLRPLVDLDWSRGISLNHEARMAFFCFDSSRHEDLARGRVAQEQLLDMATKFQVLNAQGKLDGYLKVAIVHHHPYPYGTENEVSILDPRGWVGREEFIEMRDARQFLSWCAGRDIGLILHGHKHVPRLIVENVSTGYPGDHRKVTTVGCGSSLGANKGPLSFNLIEWSPESQSWSVIFMIDRNDGQGFRSHYVQASPTIT
ncbi:metallophosphoesterase [Streptomyces sp. NPDC000618]|uniref:metallophosphoesterase family protein n=1 Tax=Streptomyces sp. NPDC000618 TaxID=3154265 RepID=UPI00331E4C88